MKVGVLGNIHKIKTAETLEGILRFLQSAGYETVHFSSPKEIDGVDVVLILGGDGAILHSAVYAAQKEIKIIGVNYGNLGFLTEYEKDEVERVKEMLDDLRAGTCSVIKRSLLQLTVRDKTYYALNEVSVQRDYGAISSTSTQILGLNVSAKEGDYAFAGDGAIICTPTGSTAYSLSAGGAILTPEVPVFMMTPICAFSMRARPIVFADTDEFTLSVAKGKAVVQVDGSAVAALAEGGEIKIKKAPFTADFPIKQGGNFFTRVRNKLNG